MRRTHGPAKHSIPASQQMYKQVSDDGDSVSIQCLVCGVEWPSLSKHTLASWNSRAFQKHKDEMAICIRPSGQVSAQSVQSAQNHAPQNESVTATQTKTSTQEEVLFEGTKTIERPDGTKETIQGKETRRTESVTVTQEVKTLRQTVHKLTMTNLEQDNLMKHMAIEKQKEMEVEIERRVAKALEEKYREMGSFFAAQAYHSNAVTALDGYLLAQLGRKFLAIYKQKPPAERAQYAEPINIWQHFCAPDMDEEDVKEKLDAMAGDDEYFKLYCPTVATMATPDMLRALNMYPEEPMEEDATEEEGMEEEVMEEVGTDYAPCKLDKVPMSEWQKDTIERNLEHYMTRGWKYHKSTWHQQWSPPTLVTIVDKVTHTRSGYDPVTGRVCNIRGVMEYSCCFRHKDGDEKKIWVDAKLLESVADKYKPYHRALQQFRYAK